MKENVSKVPFKNYGIYTDAYDAENMRKWCEVNYDSIFEVKIIENNFYVVKS